MLLFTALLNRFEEYSTVHTCKFKEINDLKFRVIYHHYLFNYSERNSVVYIIEFSLNFVYQTFAISFIWLVNVLEMKTDNISKENLECYRCKYKNKFDSVVKYTKCILMFTIQDTNHSINKYSFPYFAPLQIHTYQYQRILSLSSMSWI